jgi:hypothetical protein
MLASALSFSKLYKFAASNVSFLSFDDLSFRITLKSQFINKKGCLNYKEEGRDQAHRTSGNLSHPA